MIIVRGVVQKLVFQPTIGCQWLRRQEGVLLGEPWEWTTRSGEGFVFESLELAEAVAARLGGMANHVHAVVAGSGLVAQATRPARGMTPAVAPWDAPRAEERRRRHQEILAAMHLD